MSSIIKEVDSSLALDDTGNPAHWGQTAPDQFMKHLDTSFESFFYQRDYNEKNFTFYL